MYLLRPTVVNLDWRVCVRKIVDRKRKALVGGVSHGSFIKSQRRLQITPLKSYKTLVTKLEAQMKDQKI